MGILLWTLGGKLLHKLFFSTFPHRPWPHFTNQHFSLLTLSQILYFPMCLVLSLQNTPSLPILILSILILMAALKMTYSADSSTDHVAITFIYSHTNVLSQSVTWTPVLGRGKCWKADTSNNAKQFLILNICI